MIRRAAIALAFSLACGAAANAAPAVFQTTAVGGGASSTTATFGSAPSNGDVVAIIDASLATSGVAPTGVTDSNSAALTQRTNFSAVIAGSNIGEWGFDYVVSGTPTGTYSLTCGAANCAIKVVGFDITGSTAPGIYTFNSGTGTTPSTTVTAVVGDVVACGVSTSSAAQTLSMTGASGVTTVNAAAQRSWAYGIATSTTVTVNGSGAATWVLTCGDYTSSGGGATVHQLLTLGVGYDLFSLARLAGVA